MGDNANKLYFDTVKEGRECFFVEYRPPVPGYRFASLQLVFTEPTDRGVIAEAMEAEAKVWLRRYPVTAMVSAFDDTGRIIHLAPARACDHLFAFLRNPGGEPVYAWYILQEGEMPEQALDEQSLRHIYPDIPCKTGEQLRRDAEKHAKIFRAGWLLLFLWLVLVPAVVAILGFSNAWVGAAALAYSLYMALVQALKLSGRWIKSPHDRQREEEELRMRHHHYHCERNPDAFRRLRAENFDNDDRAKIREESNELKRKTPNRIEGN